jgi:hypothetical protein
MPRDQETPTDSQVPFGLSEAAWNALVDEPDSDQVIIEALRLALGGEPNV